MEMFSFADVKQMLSKDSLMVIMFSEGPHSYEVKVHVQDMTDEHIIVSSPHEKLLQKIPLGPTLSGLFYGEHGILGFHITCVGVRRMNDQLSLMLQPAHSAWRIERRQYPRIKVNKSILCDAVVVDGDHFEPMQHIQEAFLVNICKSGVAMQANEHVEVGDYVYILLNLDDHVEIDNLCVVVWGVHNPLDNDDFLYTYGLRFVNSSSRVLDMIEDFVSQRLFHRAE